MTVYNVRHTSSDGKSWHGRWSGELKFQKVSLYMY